jgi:hypothetical protein
MRDLKVIYVRDIAPVYQADFEWETRTLILGGEDFTSAFAVNINGTEVTDFDVIGSNRIELVLPEDLRDQRIRTIDVYSEAFTSTITSFLEPRLGEMPQWSEGLHKLVQQYSKLLLTSPGSNYFRLDEGGGIPQLAGVPIKDLTAKNLIIQIMQGAKAVEKQIKRSQAGRNMPKEEKLLEAVIVDARYTQQAAGIAVKIRLENEAKQLAVFNMGLRNTPM